MSLPDSPSDRPTVPPFLPGTVAALSRRCGRPSCPCAHAEPPGPYYHRVWREAGKMRKVYVPLRDLDAVRAACDAQRAADQEQELRDREYPANRRLEAVLRTGRDTARQIARALAAAARVQENITAAKEIGKDAAAVTAQARYLSDQSAKSRREAQAIRGTGQKASEQQRALEQRKSLLEAIFFAASFQGPGASVTGEALRGELGLTPEGFAACIEALFTAGYVQAGSEDAYQITPAGISALRLGSV